MSSHCLNIDNKILSFSYLTLIVGFVDFYQFLIKHSKKEPVILAKPSKILADILKDRFAITDPKRCLFIGDSLKLDIAFGKSVGFQTLFVSSGVDTEEDMLNAPDESTPDYYTESVADIIDILCK